MKIISENSSTFCGNGGEVGIKLYGGVSGNADEAVKAFLDGALEYNSDVKCNHHGEGHTCGEHHDEDHPCGGHCGH